MKHKNSILLGVLVMVALYILVSFGNWQVRRLAWKEDLLAKVKERATSAAVELASVQPDCAINPDKNEYRKVKLTGRFLHQYERHVYALYKDGYPGWHVYTPFIPDGWQALKNKSTKSCVPEFVFVNRGFIPMGLKKSQAHIQAQPKGIVSLAGLMRHRPAPRNWFSPKNDPALNLYFGINTVDDLMTTEFRNNENGSLARFSIDQTSARGSGFSPRPGVTRIKLPNNHLGYIITWYGLALALLGVYGFFLYGNRNRPASDKPTKDQQ